MAINRNKVKAKIASLQKKGGDVDKEKYFWTPKIGKHQVRIVPSAHQEGGDSFIEKYLYYGYPGGIFQSIENDPIVKAANELKRSSSEASRKTGYSLMPKMRVFVPVLVRGEEDKGIRYYSFGKKLYEQLLEYADNEEDYGDFTDVKSGHDFTVSVSKATMEGGKEFNEATWTIKPKPSTLSTNPAEVESWLDEQPDLNEFYKILSEEEMIAALDSRMESDIAKAAEAEKAAKGESEEEGNESEEEAEAPAPTASKPAAAKGSKYKNLF